MNRPEAMQTILDRYPKIFPADPKDGSRLEFGCDEGWFPILEHLCATVQDHIDNTTFSVAGGDGEPLSLNPPLLVFEVIKEKLGTGRFYEKLTPYPDETAAALGEEALSKTLAICSAKFDGMILFAEHLTAVTCEKCGKPGELMNRKGYLATRCPKCAKREGFKLRPSQSSPSTRLTITPHSAEVRNDEPKSSTQSDL